MAENIENVLNLEKKNGWHRIEQQEKAELMQFAEQYKDFLNIAKTERETVEFFLKLAEEHGFTNIENTNTLTPGKKIYIRENKIVAFVVIGKKSIKDGVRCIVSHIDSPRLDLKPSPVIEDADSSTALFKTHYYGGIKKYQWQSRPLAIHGVVVTKDGLTIKLKIGENSDEPVFVIPDIEPHLSKKVQGDKKLFDAFEGENLQILVSSIPVKEDKIKEKLKTAVLQYLYEKYHITETDFQSADIKIVPAEKARDVGFDKSIIGAYGQDDRICAYTSFRAMLDVVSPTYTSIVIVYDKEEIGSVGKTGAKSNFIDYVITKLLALSFDQYNYGDFITIMHKSKAISADVNAVINPLFKQVQDLPNAAKLGYGVVLTKYTGSGGKYHSSEASPEYIAELRKLFDSHNVIYQSGLLGKVDEGGGGTIAQDFAKYGMEVVDLGPGLVSMHSPFELVSKLDLWSAYKAYRSFFS